MEGDDTLSPPPFKKRKLEEVKTNTSGQSDEIPSEFVEIEVETKIDVLAFGIIEKLKIISNNQRISSYQTWITLNAPYGALFRKTLSGKIEYLSMRINKNLLSNDKQNEFESFLSFIYDTMQRFNPNQFENHRNHLNSNFKKYQHVDRRNKKFRLIVYGHESDEFALYDLFENPLLYSTITDEDQTTIEAQVGLDFEEDTLDGWRHKFKINELGTPTSKDLINNSILGYNNSFIVFSEDGSLDIKKFLITHNDNEKFHVNAPEDCAVCAEHASGIITRRWYSVKHLGFCGWDFGLSKLSYDMKLIDESVGIEVPKNLLKIVCDYKNGNFYSNYETIFKLFCKEFYN